MNVSIFSNDHAAAERLRSALSECDILCPINRVQPIPSVGAGFAPTPEALEVAFVIVLEDDESLLWLEEACTRGLDAVIAVGAARDPQFMLRVIQAGPNDYLDIDGNLKEDLWRALGRIQKKRTHQADGQLISVFSHCGGSGCSFLATNLAVALSEAHQECLLCDFNVRRGDLATLLNLKPQFTINDLTRELAKLRGELFDQVLIRHATGVRLLAAPTSLSDVHPIPVEAINSILKLARERFAFTVSDLEDFFHAEQYELLRQSDSILFVLRLDYTSLRNARRTFEHLEQDGIEPGRIRLVANQYGRPRELTPRQAEEVLGRKPEFYIPFDARTAITSVNRGEPLLVSHPRSKIARAIRQIATTLAVPQSAVAPT